MTATTGDVTAGDRRGGDWRSFRSWDVAEILTAVLLGAWVVRFAFALAGSALEITSNGLGANDPYGTSQLSRAVALQYLGSSAELGGTVLLIALIVLWWHADQWTAVLDDADADAELLADASVHLARSARLSRLLLVSFVITAVCSVAFVVGLYEFNSGGEARRVEWGSILGNAGGAVAIGLLAVFGVFAAHRLWRSCREDASDLELLGTDPVDSSTIDGHREQS